jgi:hypothetical protein
MPWGKGQFSRSKADPGAQTPRFLGAGIFLAISLEKAFIFLEQITQILDDIMRR